MTQLELARQLGMSAGYLWKIYNGYATPSNRMIIRMKPVTKMGVAWWKKARLADIQILFNRIMEAA